MTVFIGTDHNGFALKNNLVQYLRSKDIQVEDMGNRTHDPEDDYPVFAKSVAEKVLENPKEHRGIVICGSGIGVSMAANRYKGVRCGLCQSVDAAAHGRANDDINVLALASDYTSFEQAKGIVDMFLATDFNPKDKYVRRSKQLDS